MGGFTGVAVVKSPPANAGDPRDTGSVPELGRSPGVETELRKWQPTPVFLPGESQEWWSLVGCHLWGCTELDTTEVT